MRQKEAKMGFNRLSKRNPARFEDLKRRGMALQLRLRYFKPFSPFYLLFHLFFTILAQKGYKTAAKIPANGKGKSTFLSRSFPISVFRLPLQGTYLVLLWAVVPDMSILDWVTGATSSWTYRTTGAVTALFDPFHPLVHPLHVFLSKNTTNYWPLCQLTSIFCPSPNRRGAR